jgi:hypothetical protein
VVQRRAGWVVLKAGIIMDLAGGGIVAWEATHVEAVGLVAHRSLSLWGWRGRIIVAYR